MLTTDRLVNTLNLELLTGEEGLDRPIKTQRYFTSRFRNGWIFFHIMLQTVFNY